MSKRKPFYSFGIIFKNDIRCLERCLKSLQPVRDAVACELVMADTGSTDGSRAVAEKYADILFEFEWCDDFSAARNAVMDRCSGDWYFSIDTDEWLDENVKELIQFAKVKKVKRDFAAYTIRNYQSQDLGKTGNYLDFSAIRLLRLSTGIRYSGCIHESWSRRDGSGMECMMLGETLVHHDGYVYRDEAAVQAKKERNTKLLGKKLTERPNDLQTLVECMEGTKSFDDISITYAQQAIEGIRQKWMNWEKAGPTAFRDAVAVANERKKPELMVEWAEEAMRAFPTSIYMNIDVAYYIFCHCWNTHDYAACVRWGEIYRKGTKDYESENFDLSETLRGSLEYVSPYWRRRLYILLTESYLNLEEYEKALEVYQEIKFSELDEPAQVKHCTNILLRLHRMSLLDTFSHLARLWDEIGNSAAGKDMAQKGHDMLVETAARAFTPDYQAEELTKEGFQRHSYTMFTCLEGKCVLGLAAAVMTAEDPAVLSKKLAAVEDWDKMPIHVLAHALKCGASFPAKERPLRLEEMETLAKRLAEARDDTAALACEYEPDESCQGVFWARALALAAVRSCKWENVEQGMALARRFAQAERQVLVQHYMPHMLAEENILVLPSMHRFGWRCAQAFDALDRGDGSGYIKQLRVGLSICEEMKTMVEFLMNHTPELQTPPPSAELLAMAEQIRVILSAYSPDDPAVAALKSTEAYQKVAYLIEKTGDQ